MNRREVFRGLVVGPAATALGMRIVSEGGGPAVAFVPVREPPSQSVLTAGIVEARFEAPYRLEDYGVAEAWAYNGPGWAEEAGRAQLQAHLDAPEAHTPTVMFPTKR